MCHYVITMFSAHFRSLFVNRPQGISVCKGGVDQNLAWWIKSHYFANASNFSWKFRVYSRYFLLF